MQFTFAANGALVFRCLERHRLHHQWLSYMATNAFGALCNYFVFVTMISSHWPLVSAPLIALVGGCLSAWGVNYSTTRLLVFGTAFERQPGRLRTKVVTPVREPAGR